MSATRRKDAACPGAAWFKAMTESYSETWETHDWHKDGDRALRPLKDSLRRYAQSLEELPEKFLTVAFDQYLAALSEGYEYQVLEVVSDLGDDRYLCRGENDERFHLWSNAVTRNLEEGGRTQLALIIRLGDTGEDPVPLITYGPVLAWKAISLGDLSFLGRALARDLWRLKGLSAVIKRDPVPFWALWSMGNAPGLIHGAQPIRTCWYEGRFSCDPRALLPGGAWKRDQIGKKVRYHKPGSKFFFEQVIIFDEKTSRGIMLARRETYLARLFSALEPVFNPDPEGLCSVSMTFVTAFESIIKGRMLPYEEWLRPFEEADRRRREAEDRAHPERTAAIDALNAAMQEILPAMNAGREPDWTALAARHALDAELLATVQGLFKKYRRS